MHPRYRICMFRSGYHALWQYRKSIDQSSITLSQSIRCIVTRICTYLGALKLWSFYTKFISIIRVIGNPRLEIMSNPFFDVNDNNFKLKRYVFNFCTKFLSIIFSIIISMWTYGTVDSVKPRAKSFRFFFSSTARFSGYELPRKISNLSWNF